MRSNAAMATLPDANSFIHPSAQVAAIAEIEMGPIVGCEASIGSGTIIAKGAIVGYRSVIGDNCYVGAGTSITDAIVSKDLIIHAGVCIGQDGFGFAMTNMATQRFHRSVVSSSIATLRSERIQTLIEERWRIRRLAKARRSITSYRSVIMVFLLVIA